MPKRTIALLLGSLLLLVIVLSFIGFDSILETVENVNLNYLIAAFMMQALAYLTWNFKWELILRNFKEIGFRRSFLPFLASVFVSDITPGTRVGGDPVRAYYVSKTGNISGTYSTLSVVIDITTNTGVFLVLLFFSCIFGVLFFNIPSFIKIPIEIILILIGAAIVSGFLIKRRIPSTSGEFNGALFSLASKILPKIYYFHLLKIIRNKFKQYSNFEQYIIDRLVKFFDGFFIILKNKKVMLRDIMLAFIINLLFYVRTYFLFIGLGYDIGFLSLVVVSTIAVTISYFFLIPAGLGVMELVMITLYVGVGVSAPLAAAVSVLERFIHYSISLTAGWGAFTYLGLKYGKMKKKEKL